MWGANKGLGEAPKSCTRKEHESATNSIAKRGQGAIAPCRVKGQRPLWGLGQRPNCSASDQHRKRTQQRRRQRSVPASNFARPQTRPKLLYTTSVLCRARWARPTYQFDAVNNYQVPLLVNLRSICRKTRKCLAKEFG